MTAVAELCTRSLAELNRNKNKRSLLARAGAFAALTLSALTAAGCLYGPDDPGTGPEEGLAQDAQDVVTWTLGARYDATKSNITFNVFSSTATRIDVYIYKDSIGVDEAASFTLTKNATTKVWSTTVSVATLQGKGVTGTVYYGYRAWGPNWPFSASWTKGSSAGFISDVDASGNRFNPNKLLFDPYSLELSHDPQNATNPTAAPTAPARATATWTPGGKRRRASFFCRIRRPSPRSRAAPSRTISSTRCTSAG